ncbi:ABC-type dipeptide/oligopeptide/nickel transport system permease subunit [Povalibacter uvarum]|uniref:ABC-type dipeptide/oligopeptide/nickel transport system permease subunit n=1 Tax=Povalibacter uvarum TaxID=732238 RepID=A0A841HKJ9_9GAMM|nr:ABC-type dipeptide/oligopeptide/nickel transport system permease subunit [Povalibacter uvarum]
MRILEIDTHGYVWFGTDNLGRWFCLRPEEVEVVA